MAFLGVATILAFLSLSDAAKVCIIGSGIGGSSAAKFLRDIDAEIEIHVFEKLPTPGGRTKTLQFPQVARPVDAGASIAHKENRYVMQFSEDLQLKMLPMNAESWGICDGKQFLFESSGSETVNAGKLWWRYGNDLMKMQKIVAEFLKLFLQIYDLQEAGIAFESPIDLLKQIGLYDWTQISLSEALKEKGLSQKLIDELVAAVTRVNYGQDCRMNALAGLVGLAGVGSDLRVVQGGFQKISNGILDMSGAKVRTNVTVRGVSKAGIGFELAVENEKVEKCDAVILAAPLEQSDLSLPPSAAAVVRREFHLTQTTFVKGTPIPAFFGKRTPIPEAVYTVESDALEFNSIGCIPVVDGRERLCKVFSRAPLSGEFLSKVFSDAEVLRVIPWRAYPRFSPPEKFSPFVLAEGLVYLNTMESAASAMEVSAIAGKNAALLLQRWMGLKQKKEEVAKESQRQVEL